MIDPEVLKNCTMEECSLQSLSITDDIKQKIKEHYERLSARYGPTLAKVIMSSALLGCISPIPGSSFIFALPFMGLGELILWLKENPQAHEEAIKAHQDEIKVLVQTFSKS